MTSIDMAAVHDRARPAWLQRVRRIASTDRLVWMALALIWLLGHTYVGIEGDARIYMGRALADLDPAGVGRDMMFEYDGQSAFTVFRFLAKAMVATFGLRPTAGLLTLVNLVAWFVAIVVFVRTVVPGRAALLVLLVAVVLPCFYAPWHSFHAGESDPIPRPTAEAFVLLAMAALCRGRLAWGAGSLVVAALFHPIMAAPGFAVLAAALVMRDRRWLVPAIGFGAAILVAAVLGLPFVSRLLTAIDPAWRAMTAERCPCLWVQLWPMEMYGRLAIEAITIAIACAFLDRTPRLVFVAALLTGLLGALASFVFADTLSSLLALQAQFWRALWLPAVLATVAAGICIWRLPSRGPVGLIAASLLMVAWAGMEWMPLGPSAAAGALGCLILDRYRPVAYTKRLVVIVAVVCAMSIALVEFVPVSALVELFASAPAGATVGWRLAWQTGIMAVPVVILACLWWRWKRTAAVQVGAGVTVAVLACLTALDWDSRSPIQAAGALEPKTGALRAMLAERPGEVLWLQSDQVWPWLGRPSWSGRTQGAAVVFSRDLAFKWHERTLAMIAHRLGDPGLLSPWRRDLAIWKLDLAAADLSGLCRRLDAPAWIIVPIETNGKVPDIAGLRVWSPGFVDWELKTNAGEFAWTSYDRHAVIPCARRAG